MSDLRSRLTAGVAWTTGYQIYSLALSFASLLVTSRLIPQADFGLASLALGPIAMLGGLAVGSILTHALFLPEGETPDWQMYFWLSAVFQASLFGLCNALAFGCALRPEYRPLGPLLHVASLGFLVEAFARLEIVMSQRELNYRRYQVLLGVCDLTSFVTTVGLTLIGHGVWGLIVGNNVVRSTAFLAALFVRRGWRPDFAAWRRLTREKIVPPLRFALHYTVANAGNTLKQLAESALMPLAFTPPEAGNLARAQGLFAQTASRLIQSVNDAATPVLPRAANDPERLRRNGLVYHRVTAGLAAGCAGFIAAAGPTLSAVVYGPKWRDADPLLAPIAVALAAGWYGAICSTTLLAAGRQKANSILLAAITLGATPGLVALWFKSPAVGYAYAQMVGLLAVAAVAAWMCRPILGLRRLFLSLAPALIAAALAHLACLGVEQGLSGQSKYLRLGADVLTFVGLHLAALRVLFPVWLAQSLDLLPRADLFKRWLRL